MRGDAELGGLVHLARAHLDLERPAFGPDHGRVQRAVAVELRHRDVVLEAAGHRLPQRVDQAERAVAVARALFAVALDDDAHRGEVVDLVELAALLRHLVVDGVEVLRAAGDLGRDVDLLELAREHVGGLGDVAFAIGAPLGDHRLDLLVLARVQRLEREILELPLERVDAEAVRERRVDLERLLRLLDLLLLAEVLDRAHVVQPVRELDQDHADVLGHRDDHLAVVLGLRLLAALELNPRQLRDALDEARDLVAELGAHVLDVVSVSSTTSCSSAAASVCSSSRSCGADACGADGMLDEVGAGMALLPLVRGGGEPEGARDELAVDRAAYSAISASSSSRRPWCFSPVSSVAIFSVYSRPPTAYPRGRNGRFQVEMTPSVLGFRRREARKIAKLARALAALDEQARSRPPGAQRHAAKLVARPLAARTLRACPGTTPSPSATTRSRTRRARRRSRCSASDLRLGAGQPRARPRLRQGRPGDRCSPRRSAAASSASSARPSSPRRRASASRPPGSSELVEIVEARRRTRFRSSREPGTPRSASARRSSGTTSPARSRRSRRRCAPAATSSVGEPYWRSGRCRAASTTRAASRSRETVAQLRVAPASRSMA